MSMKVTLSKMDLDQAAKFLQGQMTTARSGGEDALWDRTPEHLRERYRDKVKHILILCGLQIGGVSGR